MEYLYMASPFIWPRIPQHMVADFESEYLKGPGGSSVAFYDLVSEVIYHYFFYTHWSTYDWNHRSSSWWKEWWLHHFVRKTCRIGYIVVVIFSKHSLPVCPLSVRIHIPHAKYIQLLYQDPQFTFYYSSNSKSQILSISSPGVNEVPQVQFPVFISLRTIPSWFEDLWLKR